MAMTEHFFATRKAPIADAQAWPSRAAAWLAVWYNRRRRHSALAYRRPAAHEEHVVVLRDPAA